ncbi:unnamed protein product [Lathyrus sativus]|nr:unnamed protein product [Lathyrus sativus]
MSLVIGILSPKKQV